MKDLTERRRIEGALRESEERFRRLYDEAPVGYHEVDAEGRIVNINRTECEILGYSREELIGRSVFDLIAPEYRDEARRGFPEKLSGRRPLSPFERTIEARDGRRLTILIEERYKRDPEGNVVGLLSAMRDVTDQKRAEAALLASEKRNRALFEGLQEAVFVHDLEGRILAANPAASTLLGYTREEFLTMRTSDIDAEDFARGFEERLKVQLSAGHLSCEGRHRTRDGRVIPVEVNTSTIQLDGRPAVLAVLRDISERLALEETRRAFAEAQARNAAEIAAKNIELTLSEARYRQFTEGCLDGVVVIDRAGVVTLFNPAAERMFGHASAEVLGRPVSLLMPSLLQDSGDGEGPRPPRALIGKTAELKARRNGGEEFPVEVSLNAVEVQGEVQYIGSFRDQTERQRMRAMLARSERLASIGLLSAGVAHEINNPRAYVGNNLAVLERDRSSVFEMVAAYEASWPALESAAPEVLERVRSISDECDWPYVRENLPRMIARTREGTQRVATIVSNLRGLARTSAPTLEAASIPDLLDGALEMVRGRLRRARIEVEVSHGHKPPLVCVPTQISQVLLNLLINAVQAIEMTGRHDGGRIRFASEEVGGRVRLTVSDNGCGIDPENLALLFDPFFTTKDVGEGTGLGLAICHEIVTGHGGTIEVESQTGEGTTFRLYLPLETAPPTT
ncbi:MAG: PAS domain S-box protein [Isosphaeraceae bacterium]